METSKTQEILRGIRKEFFAYRNGIIADKMRKAGDPHPMMMGCLLVDIMTITRQVRETVDDDGQLAATASELWADTNSRECRLAAPMLYPADMMSPELAMQWCQSVETTEVADNLCHKLLRHLTCADGLFRQLIAQEKPLVKYTGYRLLLNLVLMGKVIPNASLKAVIEADAHQPGLSQIIKDILEETED